MSAAGPGAGWPSSRSARRPRSSPPPAAAEAELNAGSLSWGFKESFRNYVKRGDGNPPIAASQGATINADGTLSFSFAEGTYDAVTGAASVEYDGKIAFSYPGHGMNITIANPTIVLGNGTGTLKADVALNPGGADGFVATQADLAVLTTTGNVAVDGAVVTGTNLPAAITAAGAAAMDGFYAAGEALDPVSFAFTSDDSVPATPKVNISKTTGLSLDEPTSITVTGSGFDPNAAGGQGIYVGFGPKTENFHTNSAILGAAKWLKANPASYQEPLNADGTFSTTLSLSAGSTPPAAARLSTAAQVQCYVMTFAAHGSTDRSQDTFAPVTFAAVPAPEGGSANQQISATVLGGPLTLGVAGSSVALPAAGIGSVTTGALNSATVADLRGTNAGWNLVGQVGRLVSADGGVIPPPTTSAGPANATGADGSVVTPGAAATPGSGLGSARTLCSSAAGASAGTFTCGADLALGIPSTASAGDYTATLTLTLS